MKRNDNKVRKEKPKETDPTVKKSQDEKSNALSTPRPFVSKTTADIYGQKNKNQQNTKAPKKLANTSQKITNESPMNDFFKSQSSINHNRSEIKLKMDSKSSTNSARLTSRMSKTLPLTNVTVNSPVVKKKVNLEDNSLRKVSEKTKISSSKNVQNSKAVVKGTIQRESSKEVFERQRSETKTLDEREVKILTGEMVDNNKEMLNLTRKLKAKPKAFYIDLQEDKSVPKLDKPNDDEEEISYEDDFESYESDFESYHSEIDDKDTDDSDKSTDDNEAINDDKDVGTDIGLDQGIKENRDEERMLDSGSYDLRDRSAKSKLSTMENILEDKEDLEKMTVSLTDEGFQEMSSSSAVSSMKNIDVLDRPLFIDFMKSKQNKRKRQICERLKQRAADLLTMITLHEMSFNLFEMKPISYDLYMATFGRNNYTQTSVQTNEDCISEEIQTEEIQLCHKWTQNPVEFSRDCIYLFKEAQPRKYSTRAVDFISKFNYLINKNDNVMVNDQINVDKDYKSNPLRIYLEQKDGVGPSEMLPYENYKVKLQNIDYNPDNLKRVLKKFESGISNILNFNAGNTVFTDLILNTKVPFSKGYINIPCGKTYTEKFAFLNHSKISQTFFSQNKSNLMMTVHRLSVGNKCVACLWDVCVASREPLKVLIAIDDIMFGRFSGNTDGFLVAALEDSTIHLWDLSEEPIWRDSVANEEESTDLVEIKTENMAEFEKDREWNFKNSVLKNDEFSIECALHACSYTSSANVISNDDYVDRIVGLELSSLNTVTQEGGRKIVGQVLSLQRFGMLTTWAIVQDRSSKLSKNLGKAYWSKISMEKTQSINLSDYIDVPIENNKDLLDNFNLTVAKKRISKRKKERRELKKTLTRPKSAMSSEFEFDKTGVARTKSVKTSKSNIFDAWEDQIICNSLKILKTEDCESILVAKNGGEVLCCRKCLGSLKIQKFHVTFDTSSITYLEVSPHGLPYFLASSDLGTVNLYSMLENRVLLTLDCRNVSKSLDVTETCKSDHKGRYIGSVAKYTDDITTTQLLSPKIVKSVLWSPINPCCIYAMIKDGTLIAWDLTDSDIYGKSSGQNATAVVAGNSVLTLLTPEGELQIHRFIEEQRTEEHLDLFKRYVALL